VLSEHDSEGEGSTNDSVPPTEYDDENNGSGGDFEVFFEAVDDQLPFVEREESW
jgi:hypothetical protein